MQEGVHLFEKISKEKLLKATQLSQEHCIDTTLFMIFTGGVWKKEEEKEEKEEEEDQTCCWKCNLIW